MTSVLTFLSRLCDKGISFLHEGGTAKPVHAARRRRTTVSAGVGFLRRLCGGSVKNLVASLSDAGALTEQDIDELRVPRQAGTLRRGDLMLQFSGKNCSTI